MLDHSHTGFESSLQKVADEIDIPSHLHEEAVAKYEDVAEWLGADGSLSELTPFAYAQGSFRLGTVIRPTTDLDSYDIDFVCCLKMSKTDTTKKELRRFLGDRLKEREDLKTILVEKGRCWTLNFSNIFQMDILPTIPDVNNSPNGILLTDKDILYWQKSNPIDYADWFRGRMSQQYDFKKQELAKSWRIEVEDVREWQIKTTLQRAIQILKRHRDIFFEKRTDVKPSSIVITTLAARAYQGQETLRDSLIYLVKNMPKSIQIEGSNYKIKNPVADENFADKWNSDKSRGRAFFDWMTDLNGRMLTALESMDTNLLHSILGSNLVKKALSQQSMGLIKTETNPMLVVPDLGNSSHTRDLTWPLQKSFQVSVRCDVYGQTKTKKLYSLEVGKSVPKRRKLKFTAITNTPKPYEVKWQVVNTGTEAKDDLRGEFYDSNSPNERWEDSKFRGTHWVEAFVIKNNVCVARSGPYYVKVRNSIF